MLKPERLGYVLLNVKNLEHSKEFFTKAVHLEVTEERGGKVFLRGGLQHHWIVLQQSDAAGLGRIAMEMASLEDLDAMEQRLRGAGVPVESGEGLASDRVARYVRFQDPSGNPLELYADMVSMPTPPQPRLVYLLDIQHVVLYVRDFQAARDFYTGVLGLMVSDQIERKTVFMHFLNGWHHGIGVAESGPGAHGLNHICFQPPDLDNVMRARALVQRLNLPITMDLLRHGPSGSVGFYFAGEDTVIEFSYGARRFAEDEEYKPRLLPMRPETIDVWQAGLVEWDEEKMVEELRERAGMGQTRRR